MKKIYLVITFLIPLTILNITLNAQAPDWLWAKSAGGTNGDRSHSVSIDASGNAYIVGEFASPFITFDSTTLMNAGYYNICIVKYDPDGNVLWAKAATGITNSNDGISITNDLNGNVYITGSFTGASITFDSITLTNVIAGVSDFFIVKYDTTGNVLWAKSAGGTSNEDGLSISTDNDKNVYVTGFFQSPSITFDSITLINNGTTAFSDMFIVKYDSSGNVLWAQSAGGTNTDIGTGISTDVNGNIYLTGYFGSLSITFGTTTLTNSGNYFDVFVVKYDSNGVVIWAKGTTGINDDRSSGISTDASGHVYVTGIFSSSFIAFDSIVLTNTGVYDIFIVKLDSSGNFLWAKASGGTDRDESHAISNDINGNVYVTGFYWSSSITFGPTILTNTAVPYSDIFIVKYDSSGNFLWAKNAGGTQYDEGSSVQADAHGNVYVTGYFDSPFITFGSTILTNAGGVDLFLAKLDGVVGIEENNFTDILNFSPNPFSLLGVLHSSNLLNDATLTLYNNSGLLVKEIKNISGHSVLIYRANLPSGLYFIRLTQNNKIIQTKKISIID